MHSYFYTMYTEYTHIQIKPSSVSEQLLALALTPTRAVGDMAALPLKIHHYIATKPGFSSAVLISITANQPLATGSVTS